MLHTMNDVLREVTKEYLQSLDKNNPPTPASIEEALLEKVTMVFRVENATRASAKEHWRIPQKLFPSQIADILMYLYPICRINTSDNQSADSQYDLLAIYQTEGENRGLYVSDKDVFQNLIRKYNYTLTEKEFTDCMATLRSIAPRRMRTQNKDLIAVNNGVFQYQTKELLPFSPDYVFLSKSRIDYRPQVTNPVIHNNTDGTDWDIESWIADLSDDPEIIRLLWELLGAIVRPNVHWDKSAWLYSEKGNNGKGSLCELMRELCGYGFYASVSLSNMGKDFMLEPLLHASAIIVDENDVGIYIDRAANLKAIIRGDVLQINRKYKTPLAYRFHGFMVQCLNEMPRVRDKSDSFFRRQLFIPFTKCFTGQERKYIKSDYLHRNDVLEYVLHKVLHMDYYELSEPKSCKLALAEYREFNDPIRQFAEEMLPQCVWDVLPFSFLYELYQGWFSENMPSGTVQNKPTFINDLLNAIQSSSTWVCTSKKHQIRVTTQMDAPEPLLYRYKLVHWMNPNYVHSSSQPDMMYTPAKGQYHNYRTRGIQRKTNMAISEEEEDDDETTTNPVV